MAKLEIYWSFRSPYSYIAADRLCDIADSYEVETHFRLVRPMLLRERDFLARNRPQFTAYFARDFVREAERNGLAIQWPQPDPLVMASAENLDPGQTLSMMAAEKQPLLDRLIGLGVAASEAGKGLKFARAVANRIWAGTFGWDQDTTLFDAAQEAGLVLSALDVWARKNAASIATQLDQNEAGQLKYHWGVPLMVLDDEPFFGQDRIDSLVWRLDKLGLKRPAG